ncbi:hypothetical protein STENM327S_09301 [Streptomyces tendae]
MNASVRLSVSSLRAHKRRFTGTFLAVVLGVAFLAGTLVMGDTLRAGFDTMFGNATVGTDAVVRSADAITTPGESQGVRQPVGTDLVRTVERVPGVAAAAPSIQGAGQLVGANGDPIGGQGPPTLAGNWITDPELNPYRLAEGRAPQRSGEVVVNRGAAEKGGLAIGDTTTLRTPDPVEVTVVGLATFGGEDGMAQVTFTGMTRADAEKYLTARPGEAASVQVRAEPGVGRQELVDRLTPVLPEGVEAITGEESAAENTDMISSQFLTLFTTFLLVFSGIALLVATFSIHNTFAIVVAQRTRENALLRALGASRRQVTAATLVEAAVVAMTASAAGLVGGIGIAAGLQALFPAIGFPFPEGALVISALSLLLPLAVGVVVCLGSALLPAVRAGRTAPLAALRESAVDTSGASRPRTLIGTGTLGLALAVTLVGVLLSPSVWLAGLGAVLTLASFVVLGPVASATAVRVLGAPLDRLRGVTGVLAPAQRPAQPQAARDLGHRRGAEPDDLPDSPAGRAPALAHRGHHGESAPAVASGLGVVRRRAAADRGRAPSREPVQERLPLHGARVVGPGMQVDIGQQLRHAEHRPVDQEIHMPVAQLRRYDSADRPIRDGRAWSSPCSVCLGESSRLRLARHRGPEEHGVRIQRGAHGARRPLSWPAGWFAALSPVNPGDVRPA